MYPAGMRPYTNYTQPDRWSNSHFAADRDREGCQLDAHQNDEPGYVDFLPPLRVRATIRHWDNADNAINSTFVCSFHLIGFSIIHGCCVGWLIAAVLFTGEIGGVDESEVGSESSLVIMACIALPALLVAYVADQLSDKSVRWGLRAVLAWMLLGLLLAFIVSLLFYLGIAGVELFAPLLAVAFSLAGPQFMSVIENLVAITDAQMSGSLIVLLAEGVTYLLVLIVLIVLHYVVVGFNPLPRDLYGLFGIVMSGLSLVIFIAATLDLGCSKAIRLFDTKRKVLVRQQSTRFRSPDPTPAD